jgi:2-amino-4-hydroxy-6-hydroxymethyldihydropteridine diphosphokinase
MNESALAIIALGSNLGDSLQILHSAMERLQRLSEAPVLRSPIWRSKPMDCPPDSPDFLNAVVGIIPRFDETPESLLLRLQSLEREFGRPPKKVMNEARALDLDLIAFGRETRNLPELILPHPRARVRRFVLEPLAAVAPDLVLPDQELTVRQLLDQLGSDEQIERVSG